LHLVRHQIACPSRSGLVFQSKICNKNRPIIFKSTKTTTKSTICKPFFHSKPALNRACRLPNPRAGLKRSSASPSSKTQTRNPLKTIRIPQLPIVSVHEKLERAEAYGARAWSLINRHRGQKVINVLYHVATTLELHTVNLLSLVNIQNIQLSQQKLCRTTHIESTHLSKIENFYQQPAIQLSKKHRAKPSLYSQLIEQKSLKFSKEQQSPNNIIQRKPSTGYYDSLQTFDENSSEVLFEDGDRMVSKEVTNDTSMEEDPPSTQETQGQKSAKVPRSKLTKKWVGDTTISQLSATFVSNLQVEQEKLLEAGEDLEDTTMYKSPTDETEIPQQNKIRISLRKARNADSQSTLKLFKSLAHALRASDSTIVILPVNSTKQNLPALSTAANIQATDTNRLHTYFKTYYPNQKTISVVT